MKSQLSTKRAKKEKGAKGKAPVIPRSKAVVYGSQAQQRRKSTSKKRGNYKKDAELNLCVSVRTPVEVYVDGSCQGRDKAAGAGVFFGSDDPRNVSARVPGKQSSSRAEAYAILRGIQAADGCKPIIIFTDSLSTITNLQKLRAGTSPTKITDADISQDIVYLERTRPAPILIRKIKAHSGNRSHDAADALARMGTTLPSVSAYRPIHKDMPL